MTLVSCVKMIKSLGYQSRMRVVASALPPRPPGKVMVAQVAPAVRVAVGEPFGLRVQPEQLVTVLKQKLKFDYVFDTNLAADLTIVEEGTELLDRLAHGHLPLLTSCCPGYLELLNKQFPELKKYVSTCKSPQMMLGAVVKTYFAQQIGCAPEDIFMVSVMPCVKKQAEADRPAYETPSGARHVDHVITTKELCTLLVKEDLQQAPTPFDSPLGEASGGGAIFGRTGGVLTAALRFAHETVCGTPLPEPLALSPFPGIDGVMEGQVEFVSKGGGSNITLKVAVVVGLAAVKKYLKALAAGEVDHAFTELMSCFPGGCLGGGGQPAIGKNKDLLQQRKEAINTIDAHSQYAASQHNPSVQRLYAEFLGEPGSTMAHELLHDFH